MNINTYMRRELVKELEALNVEIDRRIDSGLTTSKTYKRLLAEHKHVRALIK